MSSKYETEGVHNIYFFYFYDINLSMFFPIIENFRTERAYFIVVCLLVVLSIALWVKRYLCPDCKYFALQYKTFVFDMDTGERKSKHCRCRKCRSEWNYSNKGEFEFGWNRCSPTGVWDLGEDE